MSSTAHGKQPLALRLSMKKQKGKSQAQKYIQLIQLRLSLLVKTSKPRPLSAKKHVGFAYCLLQFIVPNLCFAVY